MLEETIERIFVGDSYGDKLLGLFVVRGDNIVLMGEVVRERISHVACVHLL